MFLFKKTFSHLLSPLTVCLSVQLLGLFLFWFSRKRRHGIILVSIGTLTLGLLSYSPIPNAFLRFLEDQNHPLIVDKTSKGTREKIKHSIKWIVVLGGGTYSDTSLPENSKLSNGSLSRLIESIRIKKLFPEAKLVIAGGATFGQPPDSEIMAKVAFDLDVAQKDVILVSDAKDTKDQARRVRSIVGNDLHVLVTSASHMPRALALFNKIGMSPIPAPTDYWVRQKQKISPAIFFPRTKELQKVEVALHEYFGIIWAKIRNQI
jgi:uncharacterized SAM-binding protein YcdF (DUF218 family)